MLHASGDFEPLTASPWDDARVAGAIRAVVADADDAYSPDGLWPAEEWDAWRTPLPLTSLYVGAAGVVWALDALRRRGHAETRVDLGGAALRTLELWRETPGFMAGVELPSTAAAGLLDGESGVLAVAWTLTADDRLADELLARVRQNWASEARDVMWGAAGTLLAARELLARTGDARWAEAWREGAEALIAARDDDGLWTQRLYGETYRALGPIRGATGNVLALLGGGELLSETRRRALARDAAAALAAAAVRGDGLANWPSTIGGEVRKLQWCAGAPGIVVAAADYLDEELLLAGAELVWRAGPHGAEKGSGLCHGTAGNGYALLKAFARTGDERWLARARRFAVHALEQAERARLARGRGRYSLWTGDVGVALFAADCLDGSAAYPILETWT